MRRPTHRSCIHAAESFLKVASKVMSPARVHDTCNHYLERLRSGSRRMTCTRLREQIRELRANVAKKVA